MRARFLFPITGKAYTFSGGFQYPVPVRVCVLTSAFDAFKGGNHLPLLKAMPDVSFTILTGKVRPKDPELPPNVGIEVLPPYRSGPYYYGIADHRFAAAVMDAYPPEHAFWKRFDVIHLNQTMGPALLRLRAAGVPVLSLIHHPVSVDRDVAVAESSFPEGMHWRLKYLLLERWQRRYCRTWAHTATVSRTVAERLVADYAAEPGRIAVVPNGVDGSLFAPEPGGDTEFDVAAVGSLLHPRKGFRYLLEAYRILAARGKRIADAGRRSDAQMRELARVPNLRAFGMLPEEELVRVMRRSAVLLSASLYEGFGLSLIEALACGRPAVAFDAGATGEVMRPVDPTLLVPARRSDLLAARALEFLAQAPSARAEAGARYREAVLRLYPLSRSAEMLRATYERIVAERK